jgi:hypothetical protein
VLLAGQQGPAYFLVPVTGDVAMIDRELRRAMAKASLRESWRQAEAAGLDQVSDSELDQAVSQVGKTRKRRKAK